MRYSPLMGLEKNYIKLTTLHRAHVSKLIRRTILELSINSSYEFNKENCRFNIKSKQLNLP